MHRALAVLAVVLVASSAARPVRADEISSDEDVCRKRAPGDACSWDGVDGKCRDTTCPGIDYAGGEPKGIERSCRRCVAEEPSAKVSAPTKVEPATVPAKTSGAEASSPDGSGCAVARGDGSLLGALLGAAMSWVARRRSVA